MSWSRVFRLQQSCKNAHCFSFGYRFLPEATGVVHNFVGINSTGYGRGFNYQFRPVMTRCGLNTVSFGKCGHLAPLRTPFWERPCRLLGLQRQYATNAAREQTSKRMLFYLTGLVFAMVGCTYAAVPLYRTFCQATGYGGTVQRRESVEEKIARHVEEGTVTTREIVVQFNADVADGMPWKFVPTQREAAVYFNKVQCFCFEEQQLLPGEQIDMPVFFYIDPEFETDPKMDGINNLILSYTFFKVSEE